ncbi:PKD domain-containing protein [Stieleria sp. JC731]|uniref:PKD domain-containing protein n=1 Tax=Pirellulaceae TaxID=2691357 RepID=UPI001E6432E2|nr:PKD domain-containing protein [Stieleria sp. JC731]MCC9599430.1 PKD domain-containing protein [Stieleria sp. JC731]
MKPFWSNRSNRSRPAQHLAAPKRRQSRFETFEKRNLLAAEVFSAPFASIDEAESIGGASNDTVAQAQNVDASFVTIEGDRVAIEGSLSGDAPGTVEQTIDRFGPGLAYPSVLNFEFDVTSPTGGATLDVFAILDLGESYENLQVAVEGQAPVILFDNDPIFSPKPPGFGPVQGSVSISESAMTAAATDGKLVVTITPSRTVDDVSPSEQQLSLTLTYDQAPSSSDVDHYSFDLVAGQPVSATLQGVANQIEIIDPMGALVATGQSNALDVNSFLLDYTPSTSGTYTVRVSEGRTGDYLLQVTRDASLKVDQYIDGPTTELIVNGDFETANFDGWDIGQVSPDSRFVLNDGTEFAPGLGSTLAPISGTFDAISLGTGPGTRTLYQIVTVPEAFSHATLSWSDRIYNFASQGFVDPEQEFRVTLETATGQLISEVFSTNPGDAVEQPGPNERSFDVSSILAGYAGQEIRVRFAERDTFNYQHIAIDDVSLEVFQSEPIKQSIDSTHTVWGSMSPVRQVDEIGVAVDNVAKNATVFDTASNEVIGIVPIPSQTLLGDVQIVADAGLAFVTDFGGRVWVIELGETPSLGNNGSAIEVSTEAEDLDLSPDGKFLLVSDGSFISPLCVIDIASLTEVNTFDAESDHTSVSVGPDGSVIVTSARNQNVRRFMLDGSGNLTDTGEVLPLITVGLNNAIAPDGNYGVALRFNSILSYAIDGLTPTGIATVNSGVNLQTAVFSPDGTRLYLRSDGYEGSGFIDVFEFNPENGTISPVPIMTISGLDNDYSGDPPTRQFVYFGMEQMAISEDGSRLYVSQMGSVDVYDTSSGQIIDSVSHQSMIAGTGVDLHADITYQVVDTDSYEFTIDSIGSEFEITTQLPGGVDNEFDPKITLFDPAGNVVASDDNGLDGINSLISFIADVSGNYTVQIESANNLGGEYVLHVNHAPVLDAIVGSQGLDSPAQTGLLTSVTASFADQNLDDTHTATVDWGDGTGAQAATVDGIRGGGQVTGQHAYADAGIYTVTMTVTDDNGLSASTTTTVVVSGLTFADDQLVIIGTPGDDDIQLKLVGGNKNPTLRVKTAFADGAAGSGVVDLDPSNFSEILIILGAGNDSASIAGRVTIDTTILGGSGNDQISGGGGNDVLLGGDGDDQLLGGKGLDVIFGGFGVDQVNGQNDEDLVSGEEIDANPIDDSDAVSDLLTDLALLHDIRNAWTSGDAAGATALTLSGLIDDGEIDDVRSRPQDLLF